MAELNREEVIDYLRNHVPLEYADLHGLDLRGLDFRKVDLNGADLGECRLGGSRFQEANLTRTKLMEADLCQCNLSGANLSNADLNKAILYQANLANTKLVEAHLRFADLSQADFTNADLARSDLHHAKCIVTDFRNAILTHADLSGAMLRGAMLRGADLTGANLEGAVGLDPAVAKGNAGPTSDLNPPKKGTQGSIAVGAFDAPRPVDYTALRPVGPAAQGTLPASKYHPPLRKIPAVIFTTGGWIRGLFHVPVMHGFLEHLNLSGEMLKLTNVNLPYLDLELRFFGLRRGKAMLVLPDCPQDLLHLPTPTADYHVHRVSFLLEGGTVTGSLAIEEDIRVSDYLANHNQFLALRNCRFGAHDTTAQEESHFPVLLVNCAAMVGASDERLRQ